MEDLNKIQTDILAILPWINSFPLAATCKTVEQVSNVSVIDAIIADVTGKAASSPISQSKYKSSSWLERKAYIQSQLSVLANFVTSEGRTALAFSSAELLESFQAYVGIEQLARDNTEASLRGLLDLLVGVSVHCKRKDAFVMKIVQLNATAQTVLTQYIQRFIQAYGKQKPEPEEKQESHTKAPPQAAQSAKFDKVGRLERQLGEAQTQMETYKREREAMSKVMHGAEAEMSELQRKNKELEIQLATATEKQRQLRQQVSRDGASPINSISKRDLLMKNDHLKQQLAAKDKQLTDSQKKVEEYSSYLFKCKELQDEVELAKEKGRQADQLADKCKLLERKVLNYNQINKQLSELLGEHDALKKEKGEWDQFQSTQLPQLKAKISQYKDQVVDISGKLCEMEATIQRKEDEIVAVKQRLLEATETIKQQESLMSTYQTPQTPVPVHTRKASSKSSLADLLGNNNGDKVAALERKVEAMAAYKEQASKVADLEDSLDTNTRLKDKFQKDYLGTLDELRTTQQKLSDCQDSLRSAQLRETQLLAEQKQLSTELKAAKEEQTASQSAIKQLRTQLESTRTSLRQQMQLFTSIEQAVSSKVEADRAQFVETLSPLHELHELLTEKVEEVKHATGQRSATQNNPSSLSFRAFESGIALKSAKTAPLVQVAQPAPQVALQPTPAAVFSSPPKDLENEEWTSAEVVFGSGGLDFDSPESKDSIAVAKIPAAVSATGRTFGNSRVSRSAAQMPGGKTAPNNVQSSVGRAPLNALTTNTTKPTTEVSKPARRMTLIERALERRDPAKESASKRQKIGE